MILDYSDIIITYDYMKSSKKLVNACRPADIVILRMKPEEYNDTLHFVQGDKEKVVINLIV